MCGSGLACQRLQEELSAPATALEESLADSGQPDVRGNFDVVEPDYRQLVGHVDPQRARGFEYAERLDVRRREHCGRRLRQPEQFVRDAPRDVPALRPSAHVLGTDRDLRGLEGALIPGRSVAARVEAEGVSRLVTDERDPAVAELQ